MFIPTFDRFKECLTYRNCFLFYRFSIYRKKCTW